MGALALFSLLRRMIRSQLMCSIGAGVAIQANILYDYALVGGIKELTTASLIPLVAAILAEQLPSPRSWRSGLALLRRSPEQRQRSATASRRGWGCCSQLRSS